MTDRIMAGADVEEGTDVLGRSAVGDNLRYGRDEKVFHREPVGNEGPREHVREDAAGGTRIHCEHDRLPRRFEVLR